jgi:putative NIF3 family GTP cyclohydrolase 1 type 2
MHHPLVMECGDPRGKSGKGFLPINPDFISQMKEKRLSVFTLHVPLDYSRTISTSDAMAEAYGATVVEEFFKEEKGACGVICEIPSSSTDELIQKSKDIFQIPYADVEGPSHAAITRVAIAAGCDDKVYVMKEAEKLGAKAYLTGEVHCHIDNEYGKKKFDEMKEYCKSTTMSLIGVSHAASEYLVHTTQLKPWFEEQFKVPVTLIPQEKWWV